MMFRLCILLFLFYSLELNGQNLVPNPSFETFTTCPSEISQINFAPPWFSLNVGTPDYYHACAGSNPTSSTPQNAMGYQDPRSGNAYAGMIFQGATNAREFVGTPLSEPLVPSQLYEVKMYVSWTDFTDATDQLGLTKRAIDKIDMLFTTEILELSLFSSPINLPQISNESGNIITEKEEWVLIEGIFCAAEPYQYLTIGTMGSNQYINSEGTGNTAYYYFDDISVVALNQMDLFQILEDTCLNNRTLEAAIDNVIYEWQDGSNAQNFNADQSGSYWVDITIDNCTIRQDFEVTLGTADFPNIDLGEDQSLCEGETLLLDAGAYPAVYLWQNGSTATSYLAEQPGNYWVEVTQNDCIYKDSILLHETLPPRLDLGVDQTFCQGDTFVLETNLENLNFLWQDGSTDHRIEISKEGDYRLEVSNDCGSDSDEVTIRSIDCSCPYFAPSAFSPNQDGNNETFNIYFSGDCIPQVFQLKIFNRWGALLFKTNNISEGWDGIFKGQRLQSGVYVWVLEYQSPWAEKPILKAGDFTLLF